MRREPELLQLLLLLLRAASPSLLLASPARCRGCADRGVTRGVVVWLCDDAGGDAKGAAKGDEGRAPTPSRTSDARADDPALPAAWGGKGGAWPRGRRGSSPPVESRPWPPGGDGDCGTGCADGCAEGFASMAAAKLGPADP
jgi:hypothetical protein